MTHPNHGLDFRISQVRYEPLIVMSLVDILSYFSLRFSVLINGIPLYTYTFTLHLFSPALSIATSRNVHRHQSVPLEPYHSCPALSVHLVNSETRYRQFHLYVTGPSASRQRVGTRVSNQSTGSIVGRSDDARRKASASALRTSGPAS